MNLKLSKREQFLLILTILSIVFFFYWQILLNPLLKQSDQTRTEIQTLQSQLEYRAAPKTTAPKREIKIYPKEEQLNYILKFIDYKFRWFGIKLLTLRQSPIEDKLLISFSFSSSFYQLMGFLNSLPQLETVLLIETVKVVQEDNKLTTEMNLLTSYKK